MIETIRAEIVRFIPEVEQMLPGLLYVSIESSVASHLCACGCGCEVVTPLGAGGWVITNGEGGLNLNPSIGNYHQPCRSHYWIRAGLVVRVVP